MVESSIDEYSMNVGTFYITVDRDIHLHEREIYGPLDFLGDVGGLVDALLAIGSWFILLLDAMSGSQLTQYLLNNIFFLDNSQRAIGKPHLE